MSNVIAVALDPSAKKVVGIGEITQPYTQQTVHVFDGQDGVTVFEANDIVAGVENWVCLESSIDGDVFFVGGSSHTNLQNSVAYLAALTFDENADLVTYSKYDNMHQFFIINALRRHPDGNILFAGTKNHLVVLLWAEDEFHLISKLNNHSQGPVTDLCFNQNAVYTVCENTKGQVFYFDRNYVQGRTNQPMGNGMVAKHNQNLDNSINYEIESVRSYPDNKTVGSGNQRGSQLLPQNEMAMIYVQKPRKPARNKSLFMDYTIKQVGIPNSKQIFCESDMDS